MLEAINIAMRLEQPPSSQDEGVGSSVAAGGAGGQLQAHPAVPCATLTRIAAPLMRHLTSMLHGLQGLDEQVRQLQHELRQVKAAASTASPVTSSGAQPAVMTGESIRERENFQKKLVFTVLFCYFIDIFNNFNSALTVKSDSPPRTASLNELCRQNTTKKTTIRSVSGRSPSPPASMVRKRSQTPDDKILHHQSGSSSVVRSTQQRATLAPQATSPAMVVVVSSDDVRRRERVRHKRQRNAAAGSSVTSSSTGGAGGVAVAGDAGGEDESSSNDESAPV